MKDRTKFAIVYPVIINHSHEYKNRILPQCVFPSKEREDKTMRDVIQIFIHGSNQLSTRT
jgi:hypothetical protein